MRFLDAVKNKTILEVELFCIFQIWKGVSEDLDWP